MVSVYRHILSLFVATAYIHYQDRYVRWRQTSAAETITSTVQSVIRSTVIFIPPPVSREELLPLPNLPRSLLARE